MRPAFRRCLMAAFVLLAASAAEAPRAQAPAEHCDSAVVVENGTGRTVTRVHLRRTGTQEWGPDLLRDIILGPGEAMLLQPQPGLYDLLAVDWRGREVVLRAQDVCRMGLLELRG